MWSVWVNAGAMRPYKVRETALLCVFIEHTCIAPWARRSAQFWNGLCEAQPHLDPHRPFPTPSKAVVVVPFRRFVLVQVFFYPASDSVFPVDIGSARAGPAPRGDDCVYVLVGDARGGLRFASAGLGGRPYLSRNSFTK